MQKSNLSAPIVKGCLNRTVTGVMWAVNFFEARNCARRRVHSIRYVHNPEDVCLWIV